MTRLFVCSAALIGIVTSTAILAPRVSAGARAIERYSASAINTNNGSAGNIEIVVERETPAFGAGSGPRGHVERRGGPRRVMVGLAKA